MQSAKPSLRVAVIGAGIAGAACAQALAERGCAVQVIDKSRGAGGRLATRRLEWVDAAGARHTTAFDHGAPGFTAGSAAFQAFLSSRFPPAALAPWVPTLASGSRPLPDDAPLLVPRPDMPSICRALLRDIPTTWSCTVDRLLKGPAGWQLGTAGEWLPGHFDAVLLAMPPAQAAALLAPHRSDWAQRASLARMQPCWTLMGVSRRAAPDLPWGLLRPEAGPLSWVMRQDTRPGRGAEPGQAQWVAHARAGWSRQHLEQPAEWVLHHLQAALASAIGQAVDWQHSVVHRWRYAMPQAPGAVPSATCWWDEPRGLGVCGDFLGGAGVEGAWSSAQALAEALRPSAAAAGQGDRPMPGHPTQRAA